MKDDSGSYVVFTEEGSSASHMIATKVLETARMRRTSKRRSISSHPSENGGRSKVIQRSRIGVSDHLDSFVYLGPDVRNREIKFKIHWYRLETTDTHWQVS